MVPARALGFPIISMSLKDSAAFGNPASPEILRGSLYRNTDYFYREELARGMLDRAKHNPWKDENPKIVYKSCIAFSVIIEVCLKNIIGV